MVLLIVPAISIFTSVDSKIAELKSLPARNSSSPLSTSLRLIEAWGTSDAAKDWLEIMIVKRKSKTNIASPNPIAGHLFILALVSTIKDVDFWGSSWFLVCSKSERFVWIWLLLGLNFFMSLFQLTPVATRKPYHWGVTNSIAWEVLQSGLLNRILLRPAKS